MTEEARHNAIFQTARFLTGIMVGFCVFGMMLLGGCSTSTSTSLSQMAFTHRAVPWCAMYVGSMQEYAEPILVVYETTELGCAKLETVEEIAKKVVNEYGGSAVVPLPGPLEGVIAPEVDDVE